MSRYDDFRSSTGSLGGVSSSEAGGGGGGRWDAERFARERQERHADTRGPPVLERPREEERDRDRFRRHVPTFEERFSAGERYGPPARRPEREYDDDHLVSGAGPATGGSLVPYDRRRREPATRGPPPPRPGLLRRQSSLDTFDRIPMRSRYNDYDRDEYSPPPPPRPIPIPVPRRQRTPPRYQERDYEDVQVAEPEYYGDEEYRHIREEEITERRRRRSRAVEEEKPFPRRGKTRMPKRMVHTRAIIELGYAFEEYGDSIVIMKALGKEHIDEVVRLSREFKRRQENSYSPPSRHRGMSRERIIEHERERVVVSPPRERERLTVGSPSRRRHHTPERIVLEEREVREISPRPHRSQSVSVRPRRRRRSTPGRGIERREISPSPVGQEVVLVKPNRYHDDDIRDEIRALEEERDALRMERLDLEADEEEREGIVEVRKDRKAPDPRIIRAMLATLT